MLALVVHLSRGGRIVNNAIDIWFDRSDPTVETLNQERQLFGADTWMLATVWMRPDRVERSGAMSRAAHRQTSSASTASAASSRRRASRSCSSDEQGLFFDAARPRHRMVGAARHGCSRHPFAGNLLVYAKSPASFSLLIKEHTGPSTPGSGPAAARLRGAARSRHDIRRSRRRPSPARPSSTPISTGCRGATSCC